MLFLLFALFSASAVAEPCPTFNEQFPTHVVDVGDYKFFYYPKDVHTNDPNMVLVEKAGELFDWQKIYFWADYKEDRVDFYNKNIDISCTYELEFLSAEYADPYRAIHYYSKGDCRSVGNASHPLICNGALGPL
jgi:hypothetical protein